MQLAGVGEVAVQAVECGIRFSAQTLEGTVGGHTDAKYANPGSAGDHVVAESYVIWAGSDASGFVVHGRNEQAEVCADGFRDGV